jgi:hypothetical protein
LEPAINVSPPLGMIGEQG